MTPTRLREIAQQLVTTAQPTKRKINAERIVHAL